VKVEPRTSSGFNDPSRAPYLRVEVRERLRARVAYDGDDEPLLRLYRNPDVVAVEVDDLVLLQPRVELRELREALGARGDHGGNEGVERDLLEVALLDPRDRGYLTVRTCHVVGDQATDTAKRHAATLLRRGALAVSGRADVLLGDPPRGPGAGDRGEVDPQLPGDLPHDGRRLRPGRRYRGGLHASGDCPRGGLSPASPLSGRLGDVLALLADDDEHGTDRRDLALGDEDPKHGARVRGGNVDRRLVRLHLHQRVVFGDLLALGDEPARDLALREALAEVGELERVGH
jgi:hypothetical protein